MKELLAMLLEINESINHVSVIVESWGRVYYGTTHDPWCKIYKSICLSVYDISYMILSFYEYAFYFSFLLVALWEMGKVGEGSY